jgi:hypothetical protein
MITAIRTALFPETNLFREKELTLANLNLQYLQISACCGQMPPQFGQVCANILSDMVEK